MKTRNAVSPGCEGERRVDEPWVEAPGFRMIGPKVKSGTGPAVARGPTLASGPAMMYAARVQTRANARVCREW